MAKRDALPISTILDRLKDARPEGSGYVALCPAHEDRDPSLRVSEGDDGRVLLVCRAGCDVRKIVEALKLEMKDLFPRRNLAIASRESAERDPLGAQAGLRGWSREALVALGAVGEKREVRFPMRSAEGEVVGWRRRRADGGTFPNGKKATTVRGGHNGLIAPWPIPVEGVALVVEGEADAAAAKTAGWSAVVATPGATPGRKVVEYLQTVLAGRDVVLAPDPDEAGDKWRKTVGAALVRAGGRVRFIPPVDEDLDKRLGRETDRRAALGSWIDGAVPFKEEAPGPKGDSKDGRAEVVIGEDEGRVNDQALAALARDEALFARGEALVEIRDGERDRAPAIRIVAPSSLRDRISRMVRFKAWKEDRKNPDHPKLVPVHPPKWCIDALHTRGLYPGIPTLEGIVEAPVLLADGTVLERPGYDPGSGLFLVPRIEFPPIPAKPGVDDARRALAELDEVVRDFPFERPEHKAAASAAILTPLARRAYSGPSPLVAVDATTRGSGKGLLCNAVATIFLGRPMPTMAAANDDDEMRKRITASVLGGEQLVLFDNVGETLGCPSLDAALTSDIWRDRILGRSQNTAEMRMRIVWFATGNNIAFMADTARRVLHVRIAPRMERPEERDDFRHKDLLDFCLRERARLYVAGLTVLRAYIVAGSPDQRLKAWGSFTGWSGLVRSALVWAGLRDPGETRTELNRTADRGATALARFLIGLHALDPEATGKTAGEILRASEAGCVGGEIEALRTAIEELLPDKKPSAQSLGMVLHHHRGRVVAGLALDRRDGKNGARWAAIPVAEGGTRGTRGDYQGQALRACAGVNARDVMDDGPASPSSPSSPPSSPDERERFEERAAIMEFDGELPREDAEWGAMKRIPERNGGGLRS